MAEDQKRRPAAHAGATSETAAGDVAGAGRADRRERPAGAGGGRLDAASAREEALRRAGARQAPARRGMGHPGPAARARTAATAREVPDADVLHDTLGLLKPYAAAIVTAVVLSLVSSACSVAVPSLVSRIASVIQEGLWTGVDMGAIWRLMGVATAVLACSFASSAGQSLIIATVTQRVARSVRERIDRKLDRLPLSYLDSTSRGDTLSRMTNDVDTFTTALSNSVSSLFGGVIILVGSLVMMVVTNWVMALAAVVATLVGFSLSMVVMRRSQPHFVAQQNQLGALNGLIEEVFAGHSVVRAYNAEPGVTRDFDRRNAQLYQSSWKSRFLGGLMMPIMNFAGTLGYVAVCVTGAVLAVAGRADIGTIVAFMLYVRLFTNPLVSISQAVNMLQPALASGSRIFGILRRPEAPDESDARGALAPADVRGEVVFDHVRFGYDPDKPVISDFSARVASGQKVAIVGPTGAGKTTLVNLLMRFYDVQGGRILIDGVDTATMRREDVRALFGMVLQDTWMFQGTLRDNIAYANVGKVTDEQIMGACERVGLSHAIAALPAGLDTVVGDSDSLSAGQRQLVTIARALLDNSPMLILDEATSSVDTRTERDIQRAVDAATAGRTSFVIAHRLSTIRNADVIFVVRAGDIVESGTHDELLAKGGVYAELYRSQFSS